MKSNYSNTAPLKDLMTVPPMTAAQHAEVMRKRIAQRHMVEEAREQKRTESPFDKRTRKFQRTPPDSSEKRALLSR